MPTQTAPPTAAATSGSIGFPAWSNEASIEVLDGTCATNSLSHGGDETTGPLTGTAFGLAVPLGSSINGISLTIHRYSLNAGVQDATVRLLVSGVPVGTDKADTVTDWDNPGPTPVAKTYGGSADTWGRAWTVAEINDSSFGATLTAHLSSFGTAALNVDYFTVTVYYSTGGSDSFPRRTPEYPMVFRTDHADTG